MEVDQQNQPAGEAVEWLQKIFDHGVSFTHNYVALELGYANIHALVAVLAFSTAAVLPKH
jgi:hypothetical protein